MTTFTPIQLTSLRDRAVEQIRTAIIEGRLKPGDRIIEGMITTQMQISRTPVREALMLLEQQGLVVSNINRGYFVRAFTQQDVREIFSLRTNLENFAGELNIERFSEHDYAILEDMIERQRVAIAQGDFKQVRSIDMSFHRYIVGFSGHSLLLRHWSELVAQIAALLYLRAEGMEYDEYLAVRDHRLIMDAYRKRDLAALINCNRSINQRVSGECLRAIEIIELQKQS